MTAGRIRGLIARGMLRGGPPAVLQDQWQKGRGGGSNGGGLRGFLGLPVSPECEYCGDSVYSCSRDVVASVSDHCGTGDVYACGMEPKQQFGDDVCLARSSLAI